MIDLEAIQCLSDIPAAQAEARGDQTAVLFEGRTMSYRELGEAASALALVLQAHGVRPDTIVALCVERSAEMMTGITGILRAGGAYMPIDPDYPDDRITWMLEDSSATLLLTQAKHRARVAALAGAGVRVIALDDDWDEVLREAILEKMPTRALQQVAIQQGMQTFWQNGLRRVLRGETTIEEIMRVLAADAF